MPDLITFAKGVNSGYVPVGGVIISETIAATFDDRVFPGGLTYSGHPLAAASIVASIDAMEEEGIVENARRIGAEAIGPGPARRSREKHPLIGEVRGEGVFWALELVADRETREPVAGARHRRSSRRSCIDARPAALRGRQPHPRRAAVRGHRRRGRPGDGDLRRGARRAVEASTA